MLYRMDTLGARAALLAGALVTLPLVGCNQHQSVGALVADAQQYTQKGNPKAAIIQLKNAMQQAPDNGDVRLQLGTIYNDVGDPLSAEKEIRKAMSLGLPPAKTLPPLSMALLTQGKFKEVLDATQSLAAGPDANAATFTVRGRAYLALGDGANADAAFQQALKVQADYPDALVGLARGALVRNDTDAAMRYSDQAIAKNPNNTEVLLFKAELLRSIGKPDVALATYDEVLKLRPDDAIAHIMKAHLEISSNKFDAASADIDAVRKAKRAPLVVAYAQARLDFSRGKPAVAMESLLQALRLAPDHEPSLLLAGVAQYQLNSMPQAEQYLRKFVEKEPKNVDGRKWLARTLLKSGQTRGAIETLKPVLETHPQDAELLTLAGEGAMQNKDYADATAYFNRAIAIAPQVAAPHAGLGRAALAQDKDKLALSELETASGLEHETMQAGVMLLLTEIRLKQYDQALASLKKLDQEHPDNPVLAKLHGDIAYGKGDLAQARVQFERAAKLQPGYFPAVESLAHLDMLQGQPAAAKARYQALLAKGKDNTQTLVALANLAAITRQPQDVTSWLERAHTEAPDAVQPAVLLIGQYLASGAKDKALTLAKAVQIAHPADPDTLDALAKAQFANGDKAGALASYNSLTIAVPTSPLAQFHLAQIYLAMDNVPQATAALKKALTLQPDYQNAQMALITIAARTGQYDDVLATAREVEKQLPQSQSGFVFEGDLHMLENKPALAVKGYTQAYTLQQNPVVLVRLHDALYKSGQGREADKYMDAWLKGHPTDGMARMYLGTRSLSEHNNKAAVQQFETVVQQHPDNAMALNDLAWAYYLEKDGRALGMAEKAYKAGGDNPAIMDTLGWILLQGGDTARALPLLKQASAREPQSGDLHYHLAAALAKSGDKAGARKELEQLLAGLKNFASIDDARTLLKQL